jgi:putative addiction module CopG family antidote
MPTRNINLTEHSDRFVNQKVTPGRYKSASKIFGAVWRLLERQAQMEKQILCRTSEQRSNQKDRPSTVTQTRRPLSALSPRFRPEKEGLGCIKLQEILMFVDSSSQNLL